MKNVLYIGNFSFPFGDAGGKRVYSNGKILKELGYNVIFIGVSKNLKSISSLKETESDYDGFKYYNFPYPSKNLDWIKYIKTFNLMKDLLFKDKIINDLHLIIYYGSPAVSFFVTKLIRFCKAKNIKIVADSTEWLTGRSTNSYFFNIAKLFDETYKMSYANKKAAGVIVASSYLENYYKKSGCKTVIIPPLSTIKNKFSESDSNLIDKKVISYAGQPFRKNQKEIDPITFKDRIDKMVMLLLTAKKKNCKFIFNVYGLTKEEYLYAIPSHSKIIDELGESICFYGPTSNEEVVNKISKSDFTFLIRDNNKRSNVGFPTKISESISCGTPVITTRTSDLENYIIEGKNGFFIDTPTGEIDVNKFIEIMNLDKDKMISMKKYCINNNIFYYEEFKDKMADFLNDVLNND